MIMIIYKQSVLWYWITGTLLTRTFDMLDMMTVVGVVTSVCGSIVEQVVY